MLSYGGEMTDPTASGWRLITPKMEIHSNSLANTCITLQRTLKALALRTAPLMT
jgi:hypothetical protein